MNFVALDFETANADLSSICQVGLVSFRGGEVAETFSTLVDPDDYFDPINISIHGIDEDRVRGAPRFREIYSQLSERVSGAVVVCHTLFDRAAMRQASAKYQLADVVCEWLDTTRVVRRTWSQYARSGYGLGNLAREFGISFNHHDAAEDARATGLILLKAMREIEASALPKYTGAVFGQELHRSTIEAGGHTFTITMGIQAGEKFAADWIYAASFAGSSNGAYLAGYSGRVIEVNERGEGLRVYDIGAVPRQIIDTGTHLYLLTNTRLYVMRGDALHALIDTFDGGELLVAQSGFGLLEKKRMRWFTPDGTYAGSVVTKDPIRRVYFSQDHLVVETRQTRATIKGAPAWWPQDEEKASS